MNIVNTLSVPFYEFRCEENLVDEVLLNIPKIEFRSTQDAYSAEVSTDLFYHKQLINWFEECIDTVRSKHFDNNFQIEITNCWVTKTNFTSKHHGHRHHQSIIGGIFYLQDSDVAETIFTLDNPWHFFSDFIGMPDRYINRNKLIQKIKQEKGKLVLYPGHIWHETGANKDKKVRYTVAFDTFFSGRSNFNAEWPYFEIKTTNIHESYAKKTNAFKNRNYG